MSRKFLAGLIVCGIIVAAIIAIFVMNGSTELTSEDFTEIKDNVVGTDPTKITKFSIKEIGDVILLNVGMYFVTPAIIINRLHIQIPKCLKY